MFLVIRRAGSSSSSQTAGAHHLRSKKSWFSKFGRFIISSTKRFFEQEAPTRVSACWLKCRMLRYCRLQSIVSIHGNSHEGNIRHWEFAGIFPFWFLKRDTTLLPFLHRVQAVILEKNGNTDANVSLKHAISLLFFLLLSSLFPLFVFSQVERRTHVPPKFHTCFWAWRTHVPLKKTYPLKCVVPTPLKKTGSSGDARRNSILPQTLDGSPENQIEQGYWERSL